jgi:hypothetical protein
MHSTTPALRSAWKDVRVGAIKVWAGPVIQATCWELTFEDSRRSGGSGSASNDHLMSAFWFKSPLLRYNMTIDYECKNISMKY